MYASICSPCGTGKGLKVGDPASGKCAFCKKSIGSLWYRNTPAAHLTAQGQIALADATTPEDLKNLLGAAQTLVGTIYGAMLDNILLDTLTEETEG